MVRNWIKMFAHQKVTLPIGRHKIVILDEADRYNIYLDGSTCVCMVVIGQLYLKDTF